MNIPESEGGSGASSSSESSNTSACLQITDINKLSLSNVPTYSYNHLTIRQPFHNCQNQKRWKMPLFVPYSHRSRFKSIIIIAMPTALVTTNLPTSSPGPENHKSLHRISSGLWPMSVEIRFVANERRELVDIRWISTGGIYDFPAQQLYQLLLSKLVRIKLEPRKTEDFAFQ